ncbi:MAG: heme NO-binding domain-containing protein [Bacteroidota bacterium]
MKGVVFTEFLEMVETKFGDEVLERIIDKANLPHNAEYTAVGSYPHHELVNLVLELSDESKVPMPDLLRAYGKHFFGVLGRSYAPMIADVKDGFELFQKLETYIHVEVRKLYPEAELPKFDTQWEGDSLVMYYQSSRKLGDFAHGLIEGCLQHFDQQAEVTQYPQNEEGTEVKFMLTPK